MPSRSVCHKIADQKIAEWVSEIDGFVIRVAGALKIATEEMTGIALAVAS